MPHAIVIDPTTGRADAQKMNHTGMAAYLFDELGWGEALEQLREKLKN